MPRPVTAVVVVAIQAIGLISEVYTGGWQADQTAHDAVMAILLNLMSDKTLSRETKPIILEAMTSMLTSLGMKFSKHIPKVLVILKGAMSVSG